MTAHRSRRLKTILDTPIQFKADEPPMSLRDAVREDHSLLRDLQTTLAHDGLTTDAESPRAAIRPAELASGDRVGPYVIDSLLGEGGMGAVYSATRTDDFEQQVALKVVKSDQRRLGILDRFYRERQILANLEHPNIARLLDGGSTGDAWPYLVMEYVDGEPIDAFCDRQSLSLHQRLELFIKVCHAVHFAHQSLIVHRDLKPGNILVTPDGEPKLLDFGIAKLLEPEVGVEADGHRTAPEQQPMTPAFASPEQFVGEPLTTASDVYSLGILLYWLTSRRPPYQLQGLTPRQVIATICVEDPQPPSAAVRDSSSSSSLARRRSRQLVGDIDAIVLKAMRKEPAQRYGSAAQLADDIQRYLDGLPVQARAGSWRYHAGKLVRRNKPAAALFVLGVALGLMTTLLWRQAVAARTIAQAAAEQAELERAEALRAQARATNATDFLEDLFTAADPDSAQGADIPVRVILDRGRERIADALGESPDLRADMLGTLGSVYNNLGDLATARDLKVEALALRREGEPPDPLDLAIDLNNLARLHSDLGDPAAAEPLLREALAITELLGDAGRSDVARLNLAGVLTHLGQTDEAMAWHRGVLERRRQRYGPDDVRVASSLFGLGFTQFSTGDLEAAERHLRQALDLYLTSHGEQHTQVASVQGNLGLVLHARGQLDAARTAYEASLATRLLLLGEDHVEVATVRKNLGALMLDLGEVEQAGRLLEPALALLRRQRRDGDWSLAQAEGVWGSYLAAVGRFVEAEELLEQSVETLERVKGSQDVFTRDVRERLERVRRKKPPVDRAVE